MRKKQRGQDRKLEQIRSRLVQQTTEYIPAQGAHLHHWPVPGSENFLDSGQTNGKIKTQVMQLLLERADFLRSTRPEWAQEAKIIVMICEPDLSNSQIMMFYQPEHNPGYAKFMGKQAENQEFIPYTARSLQKERRLQLPNGFTEQAWDWLIYKKGTKTLAHQTRLWQYSE